MTEAINIIDGRTFVSSTHGFLHINLWNATCVVILYLRRLQIYCYERYLKYSQYYLVCIYWLFLKIGKPAMTFNRSQPSCLERRDVYDWELIIVTSWVFTTTRVHIIWYVLDPVTTSRRHSNTVRPFRIE